MRRAHPSYALLAVLAGPALAEPTSSSLLFETPALVGVATGTTLVYRLERTVAQPGAGLLPSVSTVELSLQPDAAGEREAKVEIVTDERRQPAGPFPSVIGNPVLLVLLERDVGEMSRLLRGSPFYIRNRIREAARPPSRSRRASRSRAARLKAGAWRSAPSRRTATGTSCTNMRPSVTSSPSPTRFRVPFTRCAW
jgi:hypothetical protein